MRRRIDRWLKGTTLRLPSSARKHSSMHSIVSVERLENRLMLSGVKVQSFLSEGNQDDHFGSAVAIDGDTLIVGAPDADYGGAAYVYVRNKAGTPNDQSDDNWVLQATLHSSNQQSGDQFGFAVGISGNAIVIGAPKEDSRAQGINGNPNDFFAMDSGAVYVFVDPNRDGNWSDATQQAYVKSSNSEAGDAFGYSVAISGSGIVVGAIGEDSAAIGINGAQADNTSSLSGAAYVFADPNRDGTWTDIVQQAYLKASNSSNSDQFGISIAMSGRTIVVGASSERSNATGVNGDQTDDSSLEAGAAYVFADPNADGNWNDVAQQAYLKASNTHFNDNFGSSVAVSGRTIVVGAFRQDSNAVGINSPTDTYTSNDSGAAYVFADPNGDGNWSDAVQQAYLKASNPDSGDSFGTSVSVNGRVIVVGAPYEASTGTGVDSFDSNSSAYSGAAYVFVDPNGDSNLSDVTQQAFLKSPVLDYYGGLFGWSAATSGTAIVVGAYRSSRFYLSTGSASVFYASTAPAGLPTPLLVTGAGPGGGPHVRVFEAQTGFEKFSLFAYDPAFTGGVNVATGDVDADGVPDIITAPAGSGGPHAKVFSGVDGHLLRQFMAYDPAFTGGVNVSAADFDGDGKADIVTGTGAGGGPHVKIFSGATGAVLASYFAYDAAFTGGVRVATGTINGDAVPDVIVGAGPGGGPHVKAFSGISTVELSSFFAYEPTDRNGVFVAAGNFEAAPGVGRDEIFVGEGTSGHRVTVFTPAGGVLKEVRTFAAGERHVATVDANGDGVADLLIGTGPGSTATVRAIDYATLTDISSRTPYGSFTGGVFVAGTGFGRKGSPLMAADGVIAPSAGTSSLTNAALQPIVAAAQTRLLNAGIPAADVGQLSNISVVISDLAGGQLGLALPGSIVIDINAAGHGWFIDKTPLFDEEFHAIAGSQQLEADRGLAAHRMDLLTVVMHELAHELGYEDIAADIAADHLMTESLGEGIRRLPGTLAMDAAFAELS